MNGVHLALRHEGQKVNRIVMTSERMANCPPVKEWSKSFGFDSSSSLVFPCRNCGDGGGVAIYRLYGEFRRAKSYCHLYGAQGQRQAYL
ncbi:hypothetical protein TNCV_4192371 [Trichonephila clavipes]|nr:hypothetical protein TNCV_4192371 [Trichonephila clavipes]